MKRHLLITSLSVVSMFGSLNRRATACPVALGVVAAPVQAIAVAPVVPGAAVAVPSVAMPYAAAAPVVSAPLVGTAVVPLAAPLVVSAAPVVVEQVIRVRPARRHRTPIRNLQFRR